MTEIVFQGKYTESIGRRKRAIARIRLYSGKGEVVVNGKALTEYFGTEKLRNTVKQAFVTVGRSDSFNVSAKVEGGGITGQAEAIRLGIARCLVKENEELRTTLKKAELLSRDSRKRERKKPGKRGARRSPQWSKR